MICHSHSWELLSAEHRSQLDTIAQGNALSPAGCIVGVRPARKLPNLVNGAAAIEVIQPQYKLTIDVPLKGKHARNIVHDVLEFVAAQDKNAIGKVIPQV